MVKSARSVSSSLVTLPSIGTSSIEQRLVRTPGVES